MQFSPALRPSAPHLSSTRASREPYTWSPDKVKKNSKLVTGTRASSTETAQPLGPFQALAGLAAPCASLFPLQLPQLSQTPTSDINGDRHEKASTVI